MIKFSFIVVWVNLFKNGPVQSKLGAFERRDLGDKAEKLIECASVIHTISWSIKTPSPEVLKSP